MTTTAANTERIVRLYGIQHRDEVLLKAKNSSCAERLEKIKRIENYLLHPETGELLARALYADLKKSKEEFLSTEISPILTAISHIRKHLQDWMKSKPVPSPIGLAGIHSHIRYEAKGHVLVIAPWNYPLQLAITPLVHAIAAGNVVMVKPSELSAHTSLAINKMLSALFAEDEVCVVEGGIEETGFILQQPFHHIFFTGSPIVGKIVMEAAAKHWCPVTLELGGKSPVIIDETTNIAWAAKHIAWAKCLNNGQICLAPDYILIPEKEKQNFIDHFKKAIREFYGDNADEIKRSDAYGRIINAKNFDRLLAILEDAVGNGAVINCGGSSDRENLFLEPTLLTDTGEQMRIRQEEIFGPLLPLITYKKLEDALAHVNKQPRALALYIFSRSKRTIDTILNRTSSGGVAINELVVTSVNPHLPFGGINRSGIGKSNGHHGFIEFSNERGILVRKWGTFRMLYPPFNKTLFRWITKVAGI